MFEFFKKFTEPLSSIMAPEKSKKQEKTKEEAKTLASYFKDWEFLEIEGNPELKDQICKNIKAAEKAHEKDYQRLAEEAGISVEEYKEQLQRKVEEIVARSNFFRATNMDVIEKVILEDGRWKSQFETGTSNGCLGPSFRASAENNFFGFVNDSEKNKDKRPIYGYFTEGEHGEINNYGRIPPPTNVVQYGRVNFKIKKEVALKKATVTFHDSLNESSKGCFMPTPASKVHFTSLRIKPYSGMSGRFYLKDFKEARTTNWDESYTEAQFHGQLIMEDIESIHISTKNGLSDNEMDHVRAIFRKYKKQHPESNIQLIEY